MYDTFYSEKQDNNSFEGDNFLKSGYQEKLIKYGERKS